jgi:putative hydrolase of the HAD superfamily
VALGNVDLVLRRALYALLLAAVAILSACQVDTVVDVALRDDGSGTVTVSVGLDDEALERVPDLEANLRASDLDAAGWTVAGPDKEDDGLTWVRASKPFDTPEEGVAVLEEVTGPAGVLRDIELERDRSFAQTDYRISATADFSEGLAAFSDDQLTELLGDPLGGNIAAIERETGAPATDQVSFVLRADLPGAEPKSFEIEVTDPEPQQVTASSTSTNWMARGWALAAAALLVLLVVSVVTVLVRGRRRRRRLDAAAAALGAVDEVASPSAADVAPDGAGVAAASEVGDEPAPLGRRLELVVLDAMGVVFETGTDTVSMLTDFAHDHGAPVSRSRVDEQYRKATLGEIDVAALWESLGVEGDADELTDTFLVGHRVTPGLRPFLERVAARDLSVVVVADDVGAFSTKLRATHKLDDLIKAWVVSSDVGARLPAPEVFDACAEAGGVPPSNCFFIGLDRAALDGARTAGLAAAWFRPAGTAEGDDESADGDAADDGGFPVIRSFEDLGIGG